MERGTRVQEIRKRFEELNSPNNDSSLNSKSHLGDQLGVISKQDFKTSDTESHSGVKSVVKRSHAFRSDKSKVKPVVSSVAVYEANCLTVNKNGTKTFVPNKLQPENRVKLNSVLKPTNTPVANASGTAKCIKGDSLTDTIKKALKNPLPPGPAPKKPPRTFVHSGRSFELEDGLKDRKPLVSIKLSDSVIVSGNENSNSQNFVALQKRSKTEPHIMLKKLESALLSNQLNQLNLNKSKIEVTDNNPQPVVPAHKLNINNVKTKISCLNGFSSCLNGNIYDTPFEAKSTFFRPLKTAQKISASPPKNAYGSIKKCDTNHIYEEPYSPRSERKFENTVARSDQSLKTPSPKHSVHYMSSPIRDEKRIITTTSPCTPKDEKIKMITDVFNDNSRSDSDADSVTEEKTGNQDTATAVRKGYCKRISSMRQPRAKSKQRHNLFEVLLLIGLDQDITLGKVPYIKTKYPEMAHLPERFVELVFPDAGDWPPAPLSNYPKPHNNYTLCLTSEDGTRKYAYCRRLQPEGSQFCLPLAYVIITPHQDNLFYYSILAELESKHGDSNFQFLKFVRNLYCSSLPDRDSSLIIGDITFERISDPRLRSYDISRILKSVTVQVFIKIFSSLLIERKVILIGSNISMISDWIEGLQKALFPFQWEHTLIGAVPSTMLELCTAPTPILMGVIRPKKNPQSASFLPLTGIEHCLVADTDTGEILLSCGDETSLLPQRLSSCLRSALFLCAGHDNDLAPSEALVRMFIELVGHYNSHVITDALTNVRKFQRDSFIKAPKSRSQQLFLDWFTETAMFQCFIQKRLDRSFEPGVFEHRCAEHIEEVAKINMSKKEKSLNKTVKIIGSLSVIKLFKSS